QGEGRTVAMVGDGHKKGGSRSRQLPPFPTCALARSGFLRNSRIVYDTRTGMSKRNFGSSAGGFLRASVRRGTGYAVIGKATKPFLLRDEKENGLCPLSFSPFR
ncbi:hypothetical protein, partial [Treponema endosymbiont of Eucomonympha sp.]|uniref:hypothetical protein n=1 Tax=Treponema endosymbiont of Eucomonympha sp. TaxID=1580831 RepID=UPI000B110A4D